MPNRRPAGRRFRGLAATALAAGMSLSTLVVTAPEAHAAPTRCTKPAIIGASTGEYRIGARAEIEQALRRRGVDYFISTSSGRTVYQPGKGTDKRHGNGLQTVRHAKRAGADCFVIEFGATMAAKARGNPAVLAEGIDAMLTEIGPDFRVDWITVSTRHATGNWSNGNMRALTRELVRATKRWPNLDVNHWERVRESLPFWWRQDGIHLNTGSQVRGPYVAEAAFINGSR